jgi:hypothetical protein
MAIFNLTDDIFFVSVVLKKKGAYLSISPRDYIVYTKHQQPTGSAGNDDAVWIKKYS